MRTVGELIAELKKHPEDARVDVEVNWDVDKATSDNFATKRVEVVDTKSKGGIKVATKVKIGAYLSNCITELEFEEEEEEDGGSW